MITIAGKEPSYNVEETVRTITVDIIVEELGTLLEEHGNEFPFENRERVLARWIEDAKALVIARAQINKNEHDEGLTEYQTVLLKNAIINLVCYRALKRIALNEVSESGFGIISGAVRNYKNEARAYIWELDLELNGSTEYLDSDEEDPDDEWYVGVI